MRKTQDKKVHMRTVGMKTLCSSNVRSIGMRYYHVGQEKYEISDKIYISDLHVKTVAMIHVRTIHMTYMQELKA